MKRLSTIVKRNKGSSKSSTSSNNDRTTSPGVAHDSPENAAARNVRLFCESGSPTNTGEEVLHLPPIVDAAEASPAAAAAACTQIRKFLAKEYTNKPFVQYNAIMLFRILADNPGPIFTRNVDEKFKDNMKWLLRSSSDPSVQQIMRETLDYCAQEKEYDDGLKVLNAMWKKERGPNWRPRPVRPGQMAPYGAQGQYRQMTAYGYGSALPSAHTRYVNPSPSQLAAFSAPVPSINKLPPPEELAGRIEEARTSAALLIQLCSTTPPAEVETNELILEFANRCQLAQQNLTGYMNAIDPPPDENTLQTLIETVEQINVANSKHQRAVLAARREAGFVSGFHAPEQPRGVASSGRGQPIVQDWATPTVPRSPEASSSGPRSRNAMPLPSPPLPSPALRQQLNEREEGGGPAPRALYPSPSPPPVATRVNPFADDQQCSRVSFLDNKIDSASHASISPPASPPRINGVSSGSPYKRPPPPLPPLPPPAPIQRQPISVPFDDPMVAELDSSHNSHNYNHDQYTLPRTTYQKGKSLVSNRYELTSSPPSPQQAPRELPSRLAPPPPGPPPIRPQTPKDQADDADGNYIPMTPFGYEPPTPIMSSRINGFNDPDMSNYPAYASPFYNTPTVAAVSMPISPVDRAAEQENDLYAEEPEETRPTQQQDAWTAQRKHWSALSGSGSGSASGSPTAGNPYAEAMRQARQRQPQGSPPPPVGTQYVELEASMPAPPSSAFVPLPQRNTDTTSSPTSPTTPTRTARRAAPPPPPHAQVPTQSQIQSQDQAQTPPQAREQPRKQKLYESPNYDYENDYNTIDDNNGSSSVPPAQITPSRKPANSPPAPFRATPSYIQRQDNAASGLVMSGGMTSGEGR